MQGLGLFLCFNHNEMTQITRPIKEIKKDFIKTIESLSRTRHTWQAWSDFVEAAALSLAQVGDFDADREASYMAIVSRYEPGEINLFPKLLGMVTEAFEIQYSDFLGEIFMELELGNKWKGQVFTPTAICDLIVRMTLNKDMFKDGKVVSINEPAVGGGAMIIATCDYLEKENINFQRQLKITCQDVDYIAVCMCYIQLSLMGCNATVLHANTLSMEAWGSFQTPMAMMFPTSAPDETDPTSEGNIEFPPQRTLKDFT